MQTENVTDGKPPKSILKSNALKHRPSSQGVKFGPTTTINNGSEFMAVEEKQTSHDLEYVEDQDKVELDFECMNGLDKDDTQMSSISLETLDHHFAKADNKDVDRGDTNVSGHEQKQENAIDSDSDSASSVVHLDDNPKDGSDKEPAISEEALQDLKRPNRFNAIKAIPKLHLAAGDLRERRQQLLAEMRVRRDKTKSPSLSAVPSSSVDSDKKIANFQLSAIKHDSVCFNDSIDLDLSDTEIREIRTYSNPETSRLVAIQLFYERNSTTLAGRLCGHILPGSIVGAVQLRRFEYVVSVTTFRDDLGVAGVAFNTTEFRSIQFGDCSLSKYQAKRIICLSSPAASSAMSFEGLPGCMIALSGSFEFTSIDSLTPVFKAWTRNIFLTICLQRRLPAKSLSEEERLIVHKWANARVLVGFTSSVAPAWVIDAERKECKACKIAFSLWNRRHHCRICGEIFCVKCCNQFRPISSYLPCLNPEDDGEHRLCRECCQKNDAVWKIIREGQ